VRGVAVLADGRAGALGARIHAENQPPWQRNGGPTFLETAPFLETPTLVKSGRGMASQSTAALMLLGRYKASTRMKICS
jgi:hypothetical protein